MSQSKKTEKRLGSLQRGEELAGSSLLPLWGQRKPLLHPQQNLHLFCVIRRALQVGSGFAAEQVGSLGNWLQRLGCEQTLRRGGQPHGGSLTISGFPESRGLKAMVLHPPSR